jgi:hypothetical protein
MCTKLCEPNLRDLDFTSQVTFAASVIRVKFMLQKVIISVYYLTIAAYVPVIRGSV